MRKLLFAAILLLPINFANAQDYESTYSDDSYASRSYDDPVQSLSPIEPGITSSPNVFGGYNYSNGLTSSRNIFGGQNYSNGVVCTPNIFGGQNCY
jgi:hypothetical protein